MQANVVAVQLGALGVSATAIQEPTVHADGFVEVNRQIHVIVPDFDHEPLFVTYLDESGKSHVGEMRFEIVQVVADVKRFMSHMQPGDVPVEWA